MVCESCGKRCAAEVCDECRRSGVEWVIGWIRALAEKGLDLHRIGEIAGVTPMSVHRIVHQPEEANA